MLISEVFEGIFRVICLHAENGYLQKSRKAMPKRIIPLSDIQVKNAKPKEKNYKIMDGFGLYLLITPTNGKLWRFDYRFGDKRKLLAFGSYPSISVADARQRRKDGKKLLANGIDPGEIKKAQKASINISSDNSFEVVARAWHIKHAGARKHFFFHFTSCRSLTLVR